MYEELWGKIVVIHNQSKALFIWCEDNGVKLKTFLQPNNELKNAWEHVIRSKANELGMTKDPASPNDEYIKANLDKVLGHEYRAFFDISDWLSINLRNRLIETLKSYDNETINGVIPNYYTEIRPRFEKFCDDIASLRASKDIGLSDDVIKHVGEYYEIIQGLIADVTQLSTKIPALEEFKKKKLQTTAELDSKTQRWDVLKLFLAALAGSGLTLLIRLLFQLPKE